MELVYFDENNELEFNLTTYDREEIESEYEDFLDECYPDQEAFGVIVSSRDYKDHLDPIAFRCGCNDWSSEEFEETSLGYLKKDHFVDFQNALYDLRSEIEEEIESLEDSLGLLSDDEIYESNIESIELELDELREKINKIEDYED
tara:strand:+ start:3751 stop:4188 length:438 start_codon:yes stop_codon:yes gene_type:complete